MYIPTKAKAGGGFPFFGCRGTNAQEGCHRHLARLLPARCSEQVADQALLSYAVKWNMQQAATVLGKPHPVSLDLCLV